MTVLTQISKRQGLIERVKGGERPVLELHLEPGEYIAGIDMHDTYPVGNRKTTDWHWTAYIVTPLP